jgi:uncharacterized protein (DUF111 family)
VRYSDVEREVLAREMRTVDTPFGTVRVKLSSRHGRMMNAVPEFEDCAALARAHQVPVKDVQACAIQAFATSTSAEVP